ncbi:AmmeMemoRadiSam system protein B [Shewanella insulae]|uniref:AmmeMemoRadiSam system protein B n=1 Tax=Shewanella insulae TaxID=2681496 RepID=UPI001EFCDE21|nr:AmmeMemoRadiSam system protein B [Shewanella insulae]MCG9753905.1 AmmeMemoRadiSam system protein B [Shewanella insulae]
MKYRQAAVAGQFYPAEPTLLMQQLTHYFDEMPNFQIVPKALILPHAGYLFSGEVAAKAVSLLRNRPSGYRRVLLLGPSHYVGLNGCALPRSDRFITPLGEIPIDRIGIEQLLNRRLAIASDMAHQREHALEVELPLLQFCLDDFLLLPVVVGAASPEAVCHLIQAIADSDTLIVVSSDLSHYHPYVDANRIDTDTRSHILALDPHLAPEQACGCDALNGLLAYAKLMQWQIKCVTHTNSGDVMARVQARGPRDDEEVVGYASFALY